jgi:hypothetical protein
VSSIIVLLGVALIAVNGWSNGQLSTAWSLIFDSTATSVTSAQQTAILLMGGEVLLVVVLAGFANSNPTAGKFGVLLFAALWVVWFIRNPTQLSGLATILSGNQTKLSTPTSSSPFSLPNTSNFVLPTTSFNVPLPKKGK